MTNILPGIALAALCGFGLILWFKYLREITAGAILLFKSIYWFFVGWWAIIDNTVKITFARARYRKNKKKPIETPTAAPDEAQSEAEAIKSNYILKKEILAASKQVELDENEKYREAGTITDIAYKNRCNEINKKYDRFFANLGGDYESK